MTKFATLYEFKVSGLSKNDKDSLFESFLAEKSNDFKNNRLFTP